MRKNASMLVLLTVLFLLPGCRAGMGTMLGTAIGGAAGGFIPQAFGSDVSPVIQAVAPIAGAALGGGLGYMYDSKSAEEEEQSKLLSQQQAQKMQQAQMLQQTTRLSAPVVVVTGNNQGVPARNGMELANVLINIQPGTQFSLLTKSANAQSVMQDMIGNGYVALGAPRPQGQNVVMMFEKSKAQAAPMSLEQAARML